MSWAFALLGSTQLCSIDLLFLCKTPTAGNPVILEQRRVNRTQVSFIFFFIFSKLSFILAPLFLCFSVSPINKDLSIASFNLVHVKGLLNIWLLCRGRGSKFLEDLWNVRMSAKSLENLLGVGLTTAPAKFSDKICFRGLSLLET